jgi:hypothetical protein
MFVAQFIPDARFAQDEDQRQPGNCSGDQRQYSFTAAWAPIQLTDSMQKRLALQQDGIYEITHFRSKQF